MNESIWLKLGYKATNCARSARKILVRGGTKVHMGGGLRILGMGGTGLDGGGQTLDGVGSDPIRPHSGQP